MVNLGLDGGDLRVPLLDLLLDALDLRAEAAQAALGCLAVLRQRGRSDHCSGPGEETAPV